MMKGKFVRVCANKWRKIGSGGSIPSSTCCENCCQWPLWPSMQEENSIPKDVPKGHLVIYVGENHKRFVIKITLLNHSSRHCSIKLKKNTITMLTRSSTSRVMRAFSSTLFAALARRMIIEGFLCVSENSIECTNKEH